MLKMRDTCLGCTNRRVGCHGSCEKYLSAKAELEAAKEVVRTCKSHENDVNDLKIRRIQKARKKKRRYGNGQQGN